VGKALGQHKDILIRIAGAVIIVLGLHMAGAFKIKALYSEKRFEGGQGGSLPRAFVLGLAFAFGWTPCVGPILGGILGLAANQERVGEALGLMGLYCAGLAIPFFLTGLMVDRFFKAFDRIKVHFRKIEIGAGALLVVIGLMMVINRFHYLKQLFNLILPDSVNFLG
jgi:cytochrome c-type biogenesis protein